MENDPSYKQVIPYVVLSRIIDYNFFVYVYTRTKSSGETRLHDLHSIGIGGHINPVDGNDSENVYRAMHRELCEEVDIVGNWHSKIIGCLYDDSNEVGKVHFGIVYLAFLQSGAKVNIKEDKLKDGTWILFKEIDTFQYNFENWSKLTIDYINSQNWRELAKSKFEVLDV